MRVFCSISFASAVLLVLGCGESFVSAPNGAGAGGANSTTTNSSGAGAGSSSSGAAGGGASTGAGGQAPVADPWSVSFGLDLDDRVLGATLDGDGNIVLAGTFAGSIDLGQGVVTAVGNTDAFVVKLSPDGTPLFARTWGSNGDEGAQGITTGAAGNVYVAGWYENGTDFGNGARPAINRNVFVLELDAMGNDVWSSTFGSGGSDMARCLAIDSGGNVVMAGVFKGDVDFGGGLVLNNSATDEFDVFAAKYTPSGTHLWSTHFGGPDFDSLIGCALDGSDNLLLGGWFGTAIDFGSGLVNSAGSLDTFIAKLDGNGAMVWGKAYGTAAEDTIYPAFAADAAGEVFVTGVAYDATDFGVGPIAHVGLEDLLLGKLDANGDTKFVNVYGDAAADQSGIGVALDANGDVHVAGSFAGTLDFGGGAQLSAGGNRDAFLATFAADGSPKASWRFGEAAREEARFVLPTPDGAIVLVGNFAGSIDLGEGAHVSGGAEDIFVARLALP
jgi:hypothetical protein